MVQNIGIGTTDSDRYFSLIVNNMWK